MTTTGILQQPYEQGESAQYAEMMHNNLTHIDTPAPRITTPPPVVKKYESGGGDLLSFFILQHKILTLSIFKNVYFVDI